MQGMDVRQFSLRRATLSLTLIAIGMSFWPLVWSGRLEGSLGDVLKIACVACLLGLPGTGVGLLFGKPVHGAILGLIAAAFFWHAYWFAL